MVMTQTQFFGGGVGFSAGSIAFSPLRERFVYLESGATGTAAHPEDTRSWPTGLKFYVANNSGASRVVGDAGVNYTETVQDGYVGEFTLQTPNSTGGVWVFREYEFNNAGRTHGESTRSDTIPTVISANARSTIPSPSCAVWVFTSCEDPTDFLFSRQDFSGYAGNRVTFSFEPGVARVVSLAASITKPVDTRDLLSLISSSVGGGCDQELSFTYTYEDITVGTLTPISFTYTYELISVSHTIE